MDEGTIATHWQSDQIHLWPEGVASKLRLPASAVDFLVRVGLPRRVSYHLTFERPGGPPPRVPNHPALLHLGYDADVVPICLDEDRGGEVIAWVGDSEKPSRQFMNSSVNRLGDFLVVYDKLGPGYAAASDEECAEIAARAEKEMLSLDPRALADPENYWAMVLEQIRSGMM